MIKIQIIGEHSIGLALKRIDDVDGGRSRTATFTMDDGKDVTLNMGQRVEFSQEFNAPAVIAASEEPKE